MTFAGRYVLALLCVGTISCAPVEDRGFATQRDSSGILITESTGPLWPPGAEWRVDPQALVDLSTAGVGPEYEFFRIRDATRLRDGRIVVANSGTSEVRIYAPDGQFLLNVGRAGQGPGEFERLTSVHTYRGDSLVAFDFWGRRVTVLDSSGAVSRVTSLVGQDGSLTDLNAFSDGRFLLTTAAIAAMANARGRMRIPAPLLLIAPDGAEEDTVAVVRGFDTYVFDRGDARPPLAHQTYVAVHDSLTYVGDGEIFDIRVLDEGGVLRRIVRLPDYDLNVSESVRDSLKVDMLQRDLPPEFRPLLEAMANSVPTRRPAYSGLCVDAAGYVWVQEYLLTASMSPQPRRWLVFDSSGVWLGTVALPANFDLYEVGEDYVLGRIRNEMEVESIQVLRLTRS